MPASAPAPAQEQPAASPAAGVPRPLRADAARNRELLLQAAELVFSEQGLDAGVDEVARRAGVGMGTLYRRFPTKEALVSELANHLLGRVMEVGQSALTPVDGRSVERFLFGVGAEFARHGGLLCRLWSVPAPPQEIAELRATMALLVEQDIAAGTLRPDVTAADVSLALWGLQGVVETAAGITGNAAWRRHLDLFLAGLASGGRPLVTSPLTRAELDAIRSSR